MSRVTNTTSSPLCTRACPPCKTMGWDYSLAALVLAFAWPAYGNDASTQRLGGAPNDRASGHSLPEISDIKLETSAARSEPCGEEPAPREKAAPEDEPKTAKEVFSGPQKGEKLPSFKLKTGGDEEKEIDVVKDAEGKPTLIIFVHAVTRPSVGMARVLGDYAATRKKDGLHAGVVFLTADATETKSWLKRAVNALPNSVPLGIAEGGLEGPGAYGLNRNVTMTILVAKEGKVVANFALVQPSLSADGPKILKEIVDALGGGKVPAIEDLMKRPEPRREPKKEPEKKEGDKEKAR